LPAIESVWKEDLESVRKLKIPRELMQYILATDVGSTTTKARFFAKKNEEWRFIATGEAPTTVESPYEDVTMGVRNAVREIEELTDHQIMSKDGSRIAVPFDGQRGVDLYCTTSSAGGGLQMMVFGVMETMTAASARRAALGAGAIVMDVVATSDRRPDYVKISRIKNLRPDMVLIAGGTDGGTTKQILEAVELVKVAQPRPRFGTGYKVPVLYAGNKDAAPQAAEILDKYFAFSSVSNLRPVLEMEDLDPARRQIHEMFMEHVMSHAPGYTRLMNWADIDIMPTPAGEGLAMQLIANMHKSNLIGVGLGGATTNVYSIVDGKYVRSVSANLGMSYSLCNVLREAGVENIIRWLPFEIDESQVQNMLGNKMVRPTVIPQKLETLMLEHAVAREALRLGLTHHKTIATRLKGIHIQRTIGDLFEQELEDTYIRMRDIQIIAGTGGLLSHAPRRQQTMMILIDAFQPEGVTRFFQDSVFMMPHLGVLSSVYPDAAWSIFEKDCLVKMGTVIAPSGIASDGDEIAQMEMITQNGTSIHKTVRFGSIDVIALSADTIAQVEISPARHFDVGNGSGGRVKTEVMGGVVGVVVDGRGRPLALSPEANIRRKKLGEWFRVLDLYPYEKG